MELESQAGAMVHEACVVTAPRDSAWGKGTVTFK